MVVSDTPTADEGSQPYGMASTGVLARAVEPHAPQLPTGTVTFLLTDVEDNVRLFDTYPQAMRIALARHDALIEATVVRHGGTIVRPRGEGDSRFGVFTRPTDAVAAAVEIQLALAREPLGLPEPLRLHLALHTGEADVRDGDYYGSPINRCARLRGLAHGGQGLLSGSTFDLVQDAPDRWPAGCVPRFLGEFRLRGLARPERIYQLVIDGLQSDFPPLASAEIPPHNLPGQLTSFVGRERELAAIERRLLEVSVRLVTLTGPGGVGKTRLALQVAGNVLGEFKDGVYFVSLAATQEPELVPSAIAQALGILDNSARPLLETLTTHLRAKRLLLVLDNFEQVQEAAPLVAELLKGCPLAKALVTTRSILRLSGEHIFEVTPLEVPSRNEMISVLQTAEAVRLFIDRVRTARPDLPLTEESVRDIAEICARLEGLPLAIELVAARARNFPISTLNTRLAERQLSLLTGGPRDAPARHRTLRDAIAWSYTLLSPAERRLLRHLAVFVGGCGVDVATAILQTETEQGADLEERLDSLADQSLLRKHPNEAGGPRYLMFDTIREFALEQLEACGELEPVRELHAHAFNEFLKDVAGRRGGPTEALWRRKLALEQDNLRAAMAWAIEHKAIDLGLQIADTVWWYLLTYGFTHEGVRWLGEILQLSVGLQSPLRARVLVGAGRLAHQLGDLVAARALLDEALMIARSANDLDSLGMALGGLTFVVHEAGDFERALTLAEENVTVSEQIGDRVLVARARTRLAEQLVLHGDLERGPVVAEQASRLAEDVDDQACLAAALDILGLARRLSGDPHAAAALLERSVELHRTYGYKSNIAEALFRWADALLSLGDFAKAARLCRNGLDLGQESDSTRRIATALRVAAAIANGCREYEAAVRLATAAEHLYAQFGARQMPVDLADFEAVLREAERALGSTRFRAVRTGYGQAPLEVAIAEARHILSAAEGLVEAG